MKRRSAKIELTLMEDMELFRLIDNKIADWKRAEARGPKICKTILGPALGYKVGADFARYTEPTIAIFESLKAKLKAGVVVESAAKACARVEAREAARAGSTGK